MSLIDALQSVLAKAQEAPVERRLAGTISSARVKRDPFPDLISGQAFKAGTGYFGVRLAGLHVVDARRFATNLLPLCVCMSEFNRAGKPQTVPFLVGPDTIRQRLKDAGVSDVKDTRPGWIELRDLTVVKPTPIPTGNVSLFVGLYSVPGDDLVKTLLNVMGDLSRSIGVALGPAAQIAEAVYGGFGTLLNLKSLSPLAQALNGRALSGSGYLVVGSAPEDAIEKQALSVQGGRLCRGIGEDAPMVTDFDYCLLALEHHASVIGATASIAPDLFSEPWAAIVAALEAGKQDAALTALRRLQAEILVSSDLIEPDREALLAGYLTMYRRAQEVMLVGAGTPNVPRGAGNDIASGISQEGAAPENNGRSALIERLGTIYEILTNPKMAPTQRMSSENEREALTSGTAIVQSAPFLYRALEKAAAGDGGTGLSEALIRATYRS